MTRTGPNGGPLKYPSQIGEPPTDSRGNPVCECSLNWDGELPICGEPAIAKTRAMCVHEHYGEGYTCAGCLSDLRKFSDDSDWECLECVKGPQAHDCPMPMQVTVLAAVAP